MRVLTIAMLVLLACAGSTAVSGDAPAPATPVDQAEQIKLLLAKLEVLEKRIAALEEENRTLRQDLDRLTAYTELGVPFDVERAMMGDAGRFQQFAPQERFEFKVEPGTIVVPQR